MTAQELAEMLVKRYAYQVRNALTRPRGDYGDPFDNGIFLAVSIAVEEAFSFNQNEADAYMRIVTAEDL